MSHLLNRREDALQRHAGVIVASLM